ncbi:MAG: hypothetical protein PHG66_06140 [Candidatus Colwellbacteria bacterium]|nr:hypothetical protein [Candidatus Colwellbacteria bacterium]
MSTPSSSVIDESNFETTNEVIIDWIDTKLVEVCRCINIFMNYLLVHRKGYQTFSRPILHLPIAKYIVEEIFNCARVSNEHTREVYPESFSTKARGLLRDGSMYEIEIGPEIIEYLWRYISFGVANLTEGLNFRDELEQFKNSRIRRYSIMSREDIKAFKKKIDSGDESSLRTMAIKTVTGYRRLKALLKMEIEATTHHLKGFETEPLYKTEGMGVILSDEDKAVLLEFGVSKKKIKRLKSIKSSLESKMESLKRKGDSMYPFYKADCKELLTLQEETLHRMIKDLKKSNIGKFLESRKKNKRTERTGESEILDRIYESSRASADKWKRASIARILIEDADYDVRKPVPPKPVYEETDKWIRGDEDMGNDELKVTEEMIDKEYIDFNTKKEWRDFLEEAHDQLKKKIDEVDDDDLSNIVSQRIINKIKERIETYQVYVSMRECDNNFDDDIDNCIFQSLIYLSISISDWLEVQKLGYEEFKTALLILIPEGLQDQIEYNPSSQTDVKFTGPFIKQIKSYNLQIDSIRSLDIVISTIKKIKLMDSDKKYLSFNNRVRYFANSLLPKK